MENPSNGTAAVVPQEQGEQQMIMNDSLWALAMAFVPVQTWQNIYESNVALARGTIFADLDKPFIGEEAVSR